MTNAYRLAEHGILDISTWAFIPIDPENRDYQAYLAWCSAGGVPDPAPAPTMADAAAALTAAVQAWLDATAQGNGYDSLASCVSYKDSAIAQWAADATAAIAWRDAVWLAAFQWQQSASEAPPGTIPTSAEVIAQLPQPDAHGWVVHAPGATNP